jgi:MFS family permease
MPARNVLVLAVSQALGMAGVSAVILLGGIIGAGIAPTPALATLPVSIMIVGGAIASIPAALLMRRIGRRRGFVIGATVAGLAALLAATAVARGNFALFCLATLFIGANGAFVQQYRFAASESVPPERAGRAVSFVLVGGIVAGLIGPEVARRSRDLLAAAPYAGSFLSVAVLYAVVATLLLLTLRDVAPQTAAIAGSDRSLGRIAAQPIFLVAVLCGVVAYGVMSLIMTATPLQLHHIEGHSLDQTTWVIQSHVVAMYLPSLFSGVVIERLGVMRVALTGVAIMGACVGLALVSREVLHYWGALVLLGVGWNFLFVGGTVMLTRAYAPAERFRAQATNDFTIFGVQAMASLSAGTVLFRANWDVLNLLTLPLLLVTAIALLSLRRTLAVAPRAA